MMEPFISRNGSENGMTNSEAMGYMILAGKALEFDLKIIKQLEAEMKYQMDMKGEEQARKAYERF
jgi:hypothetical protein